MRCKVGTVLAGLLLLVMAAPAFAQIETMQVEVPFAFTAGKKVLPAGRYLVTTNDLSTYTLRGLHSGAIILTNEVNSGVVNHQPSLVFAKSGEQYSLLQIWGADANTGHFLLAPFSNKGKLVARAQTVEVLASR